MDNRILQPGLWALVVSGGAHGRAAIRLPTDEALHPVPLRPAPFFLLPAPVLGAAALPCAGAPCRGAAGGGAVLRCAAGSVGAGPSAGTTPVLRNTPALAETIPPEVRSQLPVFVRGDRITGQPMCAPRSKAMPSCAVATP